VVGLSGQQYEDPLAVGRAFDSAMLLVAGLAAVGGLLAGIGLRSSAPREPAVPHRSCPLDSPGWEDVPGSAPHPAAQAASSGSAS
jgi:hypothetical protein